uniref:SUN domain-containing protein 1-like isoform X3 n=1 Tax=Monopterus albus TaxID=43700 RepID=UPI0009B45AB6|nr:SUN domain-containing protein 1-like isoform X3 [Monopterus albus]
MMAVSQPDRHTNITDSHHFATWQAEGERLLQTRTMSRHSLRLDDGLLDRSLPHSSASFSVGGGGWRNTRSLKPRRSQQLSVSCSESLLTHTPRKLAGQSHHNSSLHSVASDASLLSSLLDESSIQETTLVDTLWGLDHDIDPKESTVLADSTLTSSVTCCSKHSSQTLGRFYCKDCELRSDRKESTSTHCSSLMGPRPLDHGESETSTIYCRGRSCKSSTGVLWLGSCALCVRRAAVCCISVLTHTWQACQALASKVTQGHMQTGKKDGARAGRSGVMNLKQSTVHQKELHPNRALYKHTPAGGDCKKHCSDMDAVASSSLSSVASCVLGLMWSATVFTASCLFQLTRSAASALWPLTKKILSASWSIGRSAGETAAETFRRLSRRWHHTTPGFLLTRFLLGLLPLLLLFSLCWFGTAGLQSVFPAVNITAWRTVVSDVPGLSFIYSQSAEAAVEELKEAPPYFEPLHSRAPQAQTPTADEEEPLEQARLARVEQSLRALWERVEADGLRAEQRHREVLQLYTDLQQQQLVSAQRHGGGVEPWLSHLLNKQLSELWTRLEKERQQREQIQQQDMLQQQSQASRLDQLELQLQTLAARTEEVQWKREAATTVSPSETTLPAADSVSVDLQSHDALLREVAQLKAALEDVKRDLDGVSGFQDGCRQLDTIQQVISVQVSTRVREEVRALVYGNQLTVGGGASGENTRPPESLLQWLSQQYVSGADLQTALATLEFSILQNISLQLGQQRSNEMVREPVLQAAATAVTQEDVHVIVKNALRLFSQDRTGLADYALESGGGSILSTRCSETYQTKAVLLSLFGVPLWYFSQSPRAVIQPNVHPGNCWAFRGSTGFLGIRLSLRILPTAFSLEHIPKALAPNGALLSAPRDFSVYGLDDESQERGQLLGTYTYKEDGEALQTFSVTEENDRAFQIIEVKVLSNWGQQEYTCMYRFRVHGTPSDK